MTLGFSRTVTSESTPGRLLLPVPLARRGHANSCQRRAVWTRRYTPGSRCYALFRALNATDNRGVCALALLGKPEPAARRIRTYASPPRALSMAAAAGADEASSMCAYTCWTVWGVSPIQKAICSAV